MKLNNRRTILVGLAFLSICTFWQMYDSVMTLILTDTFKLNETFAGAIMAADNVLALFLLPFFGALSDKTSTRIGRRMPFIVGGTALAAILMNLIPLLDDRYADPRWQALMPPHYHPQLVRSEDEIRARSQDFWRTHGI